MSVLLAKTSATLQLGHQQIHHIDQIVWRGMRMRNHEATACASAIEMLFHEIGHLRRRARHHPLIAGGHLDTLAEELLACDAGARPEFLGQG